MKLQHFETVASSVTRGKEEGKRGVQMTLLSPRAGKLICSFPCLAVFGDQRSGSAYSTSPGIREGVS